ncbi:type I-F CRISPR-associated protein Csy2 (plasmid) [Photobacterium leiognathi subsp. mandapamensis]|uniref:type I-F CRISPR-associated protein Csy2 n=1 Tax=Photobacterium leiognathi TaxID=553611 RepID=UPI003AF39AAB
MEQYVILKHIEVTNANAISGFTYGFPAITHFLGFVHALSRKLSPNNISLSDVAVVCHQHQTHAYRESNYEPYSFALTRNPLTKEGKTAPINEEGRMSMTVSLIIKANGIPTNVENEKLATCEFIKQLAEQQKLAGGRITSIRSCSLAKEDATVKGMLRGLLPGFVLVDRSDLMTDNEQDNETINTWLHVSAVKYQAVKVEDLDNETSYIDWQRMPKAAGYIVPIHIGYKAIAPTYDAGMVANVRDTTTPVTFVEAVHSLGEWVGAPSRITSISQIIWRYHYHAPFYVAHSQRHSSGNDLTPSPDQHIEYNENF